MTFPLMLIFGFFRRFQWILHWTALLLGVSFFSACDALAQSVPRECQDSINAVLTSDCIRSSQSTSDEKNDFQSEWGIIQKFEEFPATLILKGKNNFPKFDGRDRNFRFYRTAIRQAIAAGPNFAGAYTVIQIGCGTNCTLIYIADNRTGKVYEFPRATDHPNNDDYLDMRLTFKRTSRLIAIISHSGLPDTNQSCALETFEWKAAKAILISAIRLSVEPESRPGETERGLIACYRRLKPPPP